MAAVIGSVAAVNDFLESDEDDDLKKILQQVQRSYRFQHSYINRSK